MTCAFIFQWFLCLLSEVCLVWGVYFKDDISWRKVSNRVYGLQYVTSHEYCNTYTSKGYSKPDNRRRITRNIIRIIRILGLLQTIRGKQYKSPCLANKDRRTSLRKTIMDYGHTKYIVKYCQGTTYYLGLHRPTINGLNSASFSK